VAAPFAHDLDILQSHGSLRRHLVGRWFPGVSFARRARQGFEALRNRPAGPVRRMVRRFLRIYRYNRDPRDPARPRVGTLLTSAGYALTLRPRLLFYPGRPTPDSAIAKICLRSGYLTTNDVRDRCRLVVKWHDTTFARRDAALAALATRHRVLNLDCEDISKTAVARVFSTVFGYTLAVDPLSFVGEAVQKSDLNGAHDGRVVRCPVPSREDGCVYQRVIDNRVENDLVEDIRAPVFGGRIPFAYLKYRPAADRFGNTNVRAVLVETAEAFRPHEIGLVLRFCRMMGLDYGELDILRDRGDGRIYVVDVNTTPFGPPNHIVEDHARIAVTRMAEAFRKAFLSGSRRRG
jgi:hypothetical protein